MSTHNKDPLEKQGSPSESSESPSDSEIDKAEENLEHLKIEERLTKEAKVSGETKPLVSPKKEGNLEVEYDFQNEPVAGPSGLQGTRRASSDVKSEVVGFTESSQDSDPICIDESIGAEVEKRESDSASEKDVQAKDTDENIETRMVEGDSDTTSSTPPFIQSSTGVTPSSVLDGKSPIAGPSRIRGDINYSPLPPRVANLLALRSLQQSCSSRRFDYATDSANTSSDISEIRSEMADSSAEASVYHDAQEELEKEQSPSYASAVERQQSSETSDTNISEIQDFVPSLTPTSSSASISTNTGEQGHRAYLAMLQREADARETPISTSSGIGSTNQSELGHLQPWGEVGEMGFYRRNDDDVVDLPNPDVSGHEAQGGARQSASESMDEPNLADQHMQAFDRLFQQVRNLPEDIERAEKNAQASDLDAVSPSKRRRPSKSSSEEKGTSDKPRPRFKPDSGKKSKLVPKRAIPALESSSESPEPKSTSSEELQRKESPEIQSLSETQESCQPQKGRKYWQRPGLLPSMQRSTIVEEDDELMETKEPAPEKMQETSGEGEDDAESMETKEPAPEKTQETTREGDEGASSKTEQSESKPSTQSSDQAYGSETEKTLKEHESSFEVSDFERSVGKSKREPKLSSSPPSDEKLSSSPPKVAASRPKKKARSEKVAEKTRRTRHDSAGTVSKRINLGNIQQSESTSTPDTSDYTPSDDEKEPAV